MDIKDLGIEMKTIAVLNQKGGVGKTTTVTNTAAALAGLGAKVVVIDLDPQAHLTIHLGLEPQSIESGSYRILTQSAKLESEITMVRPNLWLLPANINLVGAESELVSVVGREIILREAIQASEEEFDYCLIDCAPSLGLLTLNALAAAEEVLIPLQPHFLALQGFGKLLQTIELVNRRINTGLKVKWILLCMFDSRASLPNEVKSDIESFLNSARGTNSAWAQAHVLPYFIRRNIKLAEAPSYGKTIFEYEENCHGAEDYRKVAKFIHAYYQGPVGADLPESPFEQEAQEQPVEVSETTPIDEEAILRSSEGMPNDTTKDEPVSIEQASDTPSSEAELTLAPDFESQQAEPQSPDSTPQMQPKPEDTDESREKPPIEIREIQPDESQVSEELTPQQTQPDQSESDQQRY
jgi:chromosome partitioning protein